MSTIMFMAPVGNREDSRRRAERARRLRAVGRTWQEIADAEGYQTRRGAQVAVLRLLSREQPESLEDQRRTAADGLRIVKSMMFATLGEARASGDTQGVVSAGKAAMDAITREAQLLGLQRPVAQQVDVRVEQSYQAIIDRAERDMLAISRQQTPAIDAEVLDQ